jgi:glycosyltransferase involved in cell wall biosynthesis
MRTLAALAVPGTFNHVGGVLVGRTVANAALLEHLARHSEFESLLLAIGEDADLSTLEALTAQWKLPQGRLGACHVMQLPSLLRQGLIDVLHHPSHVERLFDLVAVRNTFARKPVPVTGQIHSLSYPRLHQELARWPLLPPHLTDGIICSSTQGRRALERSFDAVEEGFRQRGLSTPLPRWQLEHIPLGVDVAALTPMPKDQARHELQLPPHRILVLALARFTEYDKLDAFPLLQAFQRLVHQHHLDAQLVLAGARQGTKTPEMLSLWAKHLGIADRLSLFVDFVPSAKRTLLSAADIFVSPVDNVQETFGQSVVEAMAAGLPVVVSDFDGYKDTVDDLVGIRVPTRFGVDWSLISELGPLLYERPLHLVLGQSVEVDLPALTEALRNLATRPDLRERMGQAAMAKARTHYDWPVVIRQMESLWKRLTSQGTTAASRAHPLRLDFEHVFSHFPTERIAPTRLVRRALPNANGAPTWVIYPELKVLFEDADVRDALAFCEQPRTWNALLDHLCTRLGHREPWVASLIATWLVKHGLLE